MRRMKKSRKSYFLYGGADNPEKGAEINWMAPRKHHGVITSFPSKSKARKDSAALTPEKIVSDQVRSIFLYI